METYQELRDRQQKEVNAFPMVFAFSDKQFAEAMRELGLDPTETDKVYAIPGTGGFYRRSDAPALHEMFDRHERERQEAIEADETGDGFVFQMFREELANHEYSYTGELDETIEALGLTTEEINSSPKLLHGLEKAIKAQFPDAMGAKA